MDIQELIAALGDPAVKDALSAIIKSHKGESEDEGMMEAAKMEAGVSAEDKKPEDEGKPAIMSAIAQINRAHKRQFAALSKQIEEAPIKAKAALAASIGSGDFKISTQPDTLTSELESELNAQIAAGAKDRNKAILALARNKREVYNRFVHAGKL